MAERRQVKKRDEYYSERLELLSSLSGEELSALAALPRGRTRAALQRALFHLTAVRAENITAKQADEAHHVAKACHAFGINDAELLLILGEYAHRHRLSSAEEYYQTAFLERPIPLAAITLPTHLDRFLPMAKDPRRVLERIHAAYRVQGKATVLHFGFLLYRLRWLPEPALSDLDEAIAVGRALGDEGAEVAVERNLERLEELRAELWERESALSAP